MKDRPILVIGSTGKTGRRVAERLEAQGRTVRRGARRSAIPFDWDRPDTWAEALDGVGAAYVSFFPDLAFPGASEKIEALVDMARAKDIGRLVLLSGRGESHAQACEETVRTSGLDHTLVRASWFAQNFSEGYLRDPVLQGVVAMPAGDVREPIVDIEDLADVAVAALTDDRHSGALYEITGPELLGFADMTDALSAATGRAVRYQSISLDAFHAAMSAMAGTFIADVFTGVCRETLDRHNAWLGDGVQRALGREPRSFAEFCRRAAAAGAWTEAA